MSDPTADSARAQSEAAGWFARLGRMPVATQTVRDFHAWRQSPHNDAAYSAVEKRWAAAGALASDPDILAATAEVLRRRPPRTAQIPRSLRGYALGAVAVACVAVAVLLAVNTQPTYSTRVGEQRLVVLSDGSRVRLNTDSKVQVRFRRQERRVVLAKGEAFFEAAHDAARPFIVEADGARVRAVGTKFDVRRDGTTVQVALIEGRVQVGHADQPNPTTLLPNQKLTVTPAAVSAPAAINGLQAASWTTGLVVFRDVPLETAIREINRYTNRKIVFAGPPTLTHQLISGSFDPSDTKAFVQATTTFFDLQADWTDNTEVRISPRPGAGP
jgi:transmembrane sensor